jgi:hypothetical protein
MELNRDGFRASTQPADTKTKDTIDGWWARQQRQRPARSS